MLAQKKECKMNKKLSILLLFLASVVFIHAQNKGGYNLKAKIKGVNPGDSCYLGNYFGEKQYVQDTAIMDAKGYVEFKKAETLPCGIYFIVLPDRSYFELLLDKEQSFGVETDTSDLINNMKVKGSSDNQQFYDYLKFIDSKHKQIKPLTDKAKELKDDTLKLKEVQEQIKAVNKEVENFKLDFIKKNPDKFLSKVFLASKDVEVPDPPKKADGTIDSLFSYKYYKDHYFDDIDMTDDRLLRTPIFHNKLNNYISNLVLQIPDSISKEADQLIARTGSNQETFKYIVWYITNYSERSNIMGMDAAFVHMVETYYMTNKAYWVTPAQLQKITERAQKLKPLLLGKIAPNVTCLDSVGRKISMHSVKAKYTILYIWSTDCGHCKKMTPILKDLYAELKNKGVEVYALCTETDLDEWKAKVLEYNAPWINVWDPINMSNFRDIYDVYSTPVIYLLDKDKKILAKRIDVTQLKEFIEKIDKEK